jgi:hypothetical protein
MTTCAEDRSLPILPNTEWHFLSLRQRWNSREKATLQGGATHVALADWQAPGFLVSSAGPAGYCDQITRDLLSFQTKQQEQNHGTLKIVGLTASG